MADVIVDTHAHIYDADETRYPMAAKPLRPPPGTGDIAHLRRERAAHGLHRVVLVQTYSAYQRDNRLLADTARANADWTVGVCNLDPADPASPGRFEAMCAQDNVRGLRLEVAADGRYAHDGSRRLMATARRLGAVICAHLDGGHLDGGHLRELGTLLDEFREVPVVLDHCAYPKVDEGVDGAAVRGVVALARHANLHAKLTFLVTASAGAYPFADTFGIARRVLEAYGAGRCMWGSDFPCELWLAGKASYGEHLAVVADELGLTTDERRQVIGGTALRVWFSGREAASR